MKRKWTDDDVSRAMSQDALADAENITGESYKDSPATALLGMGLHARKAEAVARMLADADDVHYRMELEQYIACVERMGWERVLLSTFTDSRHDETVENSLQVFWNDRIASLLVFDTYYGNKSVNSGKWHYAWKPNDERNRFRYTSSGSFTESGIWVGDHDCREGIGVAMRQFQRAGNFVRPWPRTRGDRLPWLAHYLDGKEGDVWASIEIKNRVSAERWAMLPENVRTACNYPS